MRDELETETGLDAMTKAELKAEARARGLPTSGTKAALLQRIDEHDSGAAAAPDAAGAPGDGKTRDGGSGDADGEDGPEATEEADADGADEADAVEAAEPAEPAEPGAPGDGEPPPEPTALATVASAAARALADLTGRTIDAVSGVRKTGGGYEVTIEVLELSRVPSTTDVLATYDVEVDGTGEVTGYTRAHRYYRNQTSRE